MRLPLRPGGRPRRLDAAAIVQHLRALVARRGLGGLVEVREACAGGCWGPGPNVSVTVHPLPRPGERDDHVAVGWRTYVHSLATLDALSRIIDDNLAPPAARAARRSRPSRDTPSGPC